MPFLLSMHADGIQRSLLGQALQMDELTAATFWYLSRDIVSQPKEAWHGPTPSIKRKAREQAHALYTRYFEPRPFRRVQRSRRHGERRTLRCAPMIHKAIVTMIAAAVLALAIGTWLLRDRATA